MVLYRWRIRGARCLSDRECEKIMLRDHHAGYGMVEVFSFVPAIFFTLHLQLSTLYIKEHFLLYCMHIYLHPGVARTPLIQSLLFSSAYICHLANEALYCSQMKTHVRAVDHRLRRGPKQAGESVLRGESHTTGRPNMATKKWREICHGASTR